MNNLHPKVQQQLAVIRRDLKAESKNNLVRAVIGFILKEQNLTNILKQRDDEIAKLKAEAEVANGFLDANEAAFQAYVDALPKPEVAVQEGSADVAAQANDNQKVG